MEEIIKVEHLKRYFNEVKAVDDVSFSVEQGELFGFLGVNGAGKSTTINMLCTMLAPTGGSAVVAGFKLGKENGEIKRHIGIVYQGNVLDSLLTVKENLFCRGSLYEKDRKKLKKNMDHVCEILSLSEVIKRPYGKLSGGQKRRCEIAAALMHAPDILFLDEPTTGLDPATRKSVWQTINRLRQELKMTVFLTTHYMEEAAKANHIAILDKGHLIQFGTPFFLKEQFAKDRLILAYKPGSCEKIRKTLDEGGISYKTKEGLIVVSLDNTMSSLSILNKIEDLISGFEVIQGTMDDVFLNAAGKENKE